MTNLFQSFSYSPEKINFIWVRFYFDERRVLYQDDVEEVMKGYVLRGLKRLLEGAMKAEVVGYLKARCYRAAVGYYKDWVGRWRGKSAIMQLFIKIFTQILTLPS